MIKGTICIFVKDKQVSTITLMLVSFYYSEVFLGEEVGSLQSLTHLCQHPLNKGIAKIWIGSYRPTIFTYKNICRCGYEGDM